MKVNFVNLTPHEITETTYGNKFQPSGKVARVKTQTEQVGFAEHMPVYTAINGEVIDLPEPAISTIYIVSKIVLEAIKDTGRTDVYAPGNLVRDDDGNIVGCNGWYMNQF